MTEEERDLILRAVCKANAGRGRIIAHIGAMSTEQAMSLARKAADLGVDAISSLPPLYYKYSPEEIKGYYLEILESVDLPMILYNFPALSGVDLIGEIPADLLSHQRVIGFKHTSSDFFQLERIRRQYSDLILLNGYDEMLLAGLSMGADGAIGSTFNFMARKFVSIYRLFNEGRLAEARNLQAEANEVISILIQVGVYAGIKFALRCQGFEVGECRKPFRPLDRRSQEMLEEVLERDESQPAHT
jgi:N-acetylneuraminate lyase